MFTVAGNHDYTSHVVVMGEYVYSCRESWLYIPCSSNGGICLQLQGIMIIHPIVVVMGEYV